MSYETRYAAAKRAAEDERANSPEAVAWRHLNNAILRRVSREREARVAAAQARGELTVESMKELVDWQERKVAELHKAAEGRLPRAEEVGLPVLAKDGVRVGTASAIEVLRETPKALLLRLEDARGASREQWFPKSQLWLSEGPQCDVFGLDLCASRSFVARAHLWHWVG